MRMSSKSGKNATSIQGVPVASTLPTDGQSPVFDDGDGVYKPGTGGGGTTLTRETATVTSSSIADDAADSSKAIALGKSGVAYTVETDAEAWVRGYVSEAARTADAGRDIATPPTEGDGVMFDTFHDTGALKVQLSPAAVYYNDEDTPVGTIPLAIVNKSGGTRTIQVDIVYVGYAV